MAHQSGYGGSVDITGGGPAAIAVGVEAWTVNQATEVIEARAKQDTWKTKFAGASEWDAQITCLVADDATSGWNTMSAVTNMKLEVNASDFFTGSGFISSHTLEDPVDGPVKITYGITGNGNLVYSSQA